MAQPSNDPKQLTQASITSRIYNGDSLDEAFIYTGTTDDNVATELFLSNPVEAGLTNNSVVEVTEQARLYIPPSSIVLATMTVMGLRIDTAAKASHHVSKWAFSVFRPTTGNMVANGEAVIDYIDGSSSIDLANPAQYLLAGTAGHSAVAINTAGYLTVTVTGATGQTILWKATIDTMRVVAD